ncbi:MAG: flagellar hook-length control protein FliK [Limnohabitans sp.]|nr:flagellar hook-length control protein FliK [Limnohabitans sp.]
MSISLLDSGPRTSSAPQTDTFDRIRDSDRSSEGPSFGRLMADMHQRQAEKAPPADDPQRNRAPAPVRPARQEVADTRPRSAPAGHDPRDNQARDRRTERASDRNHERASERSESEPNRQTRAPQASTTTRRDHLPRTSEPTATAAASEASGTEASATMPPSGAMREATSNGLNASGQTSTAPTEGTPETDAFSLKAVTLGPNLNVITPENAVPNEQSLEAFARSQGLGEKAVQWLMGGNSPTGRQTVGTETATDGSGSGLGLDGSADGSPGDGTAPDTNSTAGASTSDSLKAGLYGSLFILPSAQSPLPAHNALPPAGLPVYTSAPATGDATETAFAASGHGANGTNGATVAPPMPQNTLISAFAALMQGATPDSETVTAKTPTNPAATEAEGLADLQNSSLRLPPPAAMWMQPIKTAPSLSTPANNNPAPSISVSDLDLSADISPDLIDQLSNDTLPAPQMSAASHPAPGGGGAAPALSTRHDTPAAAAPAAPAQADAAQRSENIQNLATKMGQAVGERILSEIEKGQYHLKLQLRPATLGHIEVEMRMRSGEMDATFTAPQALTRELLQEGMSRLKETMSQMGMNVANFNVGDGQTQQRGGESTPQSFVSAKSKDSTAPGQTETMTANAPRAKTSADGLDVLV